MPEPKPIAGRYQILAELGRGGFAVVYKARDTTLDRPVALKVLHPYWTQDPTFETRFRREARAAANLRHSNIVTVYDAGEADGNLYIAMEYLPGRTLHQLLEEENLTVDQTLPILEQLAAALDYAHGQDIVHRDVKPNNIGVEETGRGMHVTLMDFGLVKAMVGSSVLTSQGTLLGSPEYMAPEQADPARVDEIGPTTDCYALGVVAYQMLAGRVPFPGNTPATLNAHLNLPPPAPCDLNPQLPPQVEQVLLKALVKNPDGRYQSARDLAVALRQAVQAAAYLVERYDKLQHAITDQNWTTAASLCQEILLQQSDYQDVLDLWQQVQEAQARQQARQKEQQAYLARLYQQAQAAVRRERWDEALHRCADIESLAGPAYRDVSDLQRQAKAGQQRQRTERQRQALVGNMSTGYHDVTTLEEEDRTLQEKQQSEIDQLLARAQAACESGDWLIVQDACVRVMQIDRTHPDAQEMMAEATAGLQRESAEEAARRQRVRRYVEGEQALDTEQWQAAIAAFEAVAEGDPDFREVQAKLAQARDELQRAQWYDEAIAHGEAERWPEACRTWLNVLRGQPDYRNLDAASRLLDATAGLLDQYEQVRLAREPLALYDTLVTAVEDKDWETVIQISESLLQQAPDLHHPQAWLARAHSKLKLQEELGKDRMIWEQDGKEMVRIPAGKFLYGDEKEERKLPEFWIDKTPVTNAEFAHFVKETGQEPPEHWKGKAPSKETADHPVVNVSWHDAVAYAEWAGKRLPTEEEWEKAARGTDGWEYPWGDWKEGHCNSKEAGVGTTTPVGQYSPDGDSPYGCMDMAGNVWEWTASGYDKSRKVLRGCSFLGVQRLVRAANRHDFNPDTRTAAVGFRCVV